MKTTHLLTLLLIFTISLPAYGFSDSPHSEQGKKEQNQTYTVKYIYNATGRLTQAVYNDEVSIRYEYDANGNILSVVSGPYDPTIVEDDPDVPKSFALSQNYPNPFNPVTQIQYQLPRDAQVSLSVYDILGRLVRTVVDEYQPAGYYTIEWNGLSDRGEPVASGIYLYRMRAGGYTKVNKMLLMR